MRIQSSKQLAINTFKVHNSSSQQELVLQRIYTSYTYYIHASSSPHIPLPEPEARYSTKPSHESGPEEVCRGQKKPNG